MRKKIFGIAVAAVALSLVAPMAIADDLQAEPQATPVADTSADVQAEPQATATAETDPSVTSEPVTATATSPSPAPSPSIAPAVLTPEQAIYSVPGYHFVNGRYWQTECSMYSSNTVRCRTNIFGTTVFQKDNKWFTQNTWVFNNLTYLPSARSVWKGNPLGDLAATNNGKFTSAGRNWRTECDTPATGRGACRNYAVATVASLVNGKVVQASKEVFNGIVRFETPATPWVKTVPPATTPPPNVPKPSNPVQINAPSKVQSGFRLDQRCMTGRAFCVSMAQNKMAWVVDGKVQTIVDVRFGKTSTPTRKGAFKIYWKSRDHFSSIYKVDMPFALFFDGGIAIHYSANFARVGYSGGSGGCVNVRDYAQMQKFFDTARVGDKVIVYS